MAGIAGRVLYDRALWEEERTREKGQQRLPLKVMDDGSDEWLVERLYRVHGSPYPYRKELHITFMLREKVSGTSNHIHHTGPHRTHRTHRIHHLPHEQLPGELDSLRDPSFGVTGRTLTSSGTFTFATRPLLYITPKENIKRHALSAALTMGFGREGWTQETDRDGQEVWVIQRPPFISEDPACDRDADDGAPRCGGLMFTFLLRNPGERPRLVLVYYTVGRRGSPKQAPLADSSPALLQRPPPTRSHWHPAHPHILLQVPAPCASDRRRAGFEVRGLAWEAGDVAPAERRRAPRGVICSAPMRGHFHGPFSTAVIGLNKPVLNSGGRSPH